jgi:hypothetical protein
VEIEVLHQATVLVALWAASVAAWSVARWASSARKLNMQAFAANAAEQKRYEQLNNAEEDLLGISSPDEEDYNV